MNRKITPFQKIVALAVTVALIAMMVAPAFVLTAKAQDLAYSNPWSNKNFNASFADDANETFGTPVLAGSGGYLSYVQFFISNDSATESGVVHAALYLSGMSEPLDSAVALEISSNTYDVSGLTGGSAAYTQVTFNFANTTRLNVGSQYVVVLENSVSGLGSAIYIGVDNTLDAPYRHLGSWDPSAGSQPCFYVYTLTIPAGGTETPVLTNWDVTINSFVSFIVPVVVVLLPALLLMLLTRRADKWLLIIGITIGAGLGYYFGMVPLWLVFLVTIGLIGMAYQSVRGGNS